MTRESYELLRDTRLLRASEKFFSGEEIISELAREYHHESNELKSARLAGNEKKAIKCLARMGALATFADCLLDALDSEEYFDHYVAEEEDKKEE